MPLLIRECTYMRQLPLPTGSTGIILMDIRIGAEMRITSPQVMTKLPPLLFGQAGLILLPGSVVLMHIS